MSDWQLLREYIEHRSEAAFAELVDKHIKTVYWTCWRDIRDAQLAEDATQAVFLLLAQKARSLGSEVSLSGWLFNTARLVSRNAVRREAHRRRIEQEAAQSMAHSSACESQWPEIEPWLNDALARLNAADRDIILMRYFDELSLREAADQLGMSEKTVSKRVTRAIDKMRRYLSKKDVTITGVALAALLAEQRSEAAPESCHAATMQAIHHLTSVPGATVAANSPVVLLQQGVYITMQATKYKYLIAGAALLLLIGGVAIPIARRVGNARNPSPIATLDPGARSLPTNDPTAAARTEIDNVYLSRIEKLRQGNAEGILASSSPEYQAGNRDYVSRWKDILTGSGRYAGTCQIAGDIQSFEIHGDKATVTMHYRTSGAYKSSPLVQNDDITVVDYWERRNGAWLNDKSDHWSRGYTQHTSNR